MIYRWEKTTSNSFYYNICESNNNIIMYDNNGFLESYNKKTGDKKSVKLAEDVPTIVIKLNDKYVVYERKYDHTVDKIYYHKVVLTLYNDNLEVIKQKEYISANYFISMVEKDNKVILMDYTGNEFILDKFN